MKAKELIEKLKKVNQETEIVLFNGEFWDIANKVEEGKFKDYDGEIYEEEDGDTFLFLSGEP